MAMWDMDTFDCGHHMWISGMMIVSNQDLLTVSKSRRIICHNCDVVFNLEMHSEYLNMP